MRTKVNTIRLVTPKKGNKGRVHPQGTLMTSKLCHYFEPSRVVHGADEITTPHFYSQVSFLSICGPQVDTLPY